MSTRPTRRRVKKKRSTTLDPSQTNIGLYSLSLSPSPKKNQDKKLKRTSKSKRMIKSKSPNFKNKNKHKNVRRRATSDAPSKSEMKTISLKLDTKRIKKKRKTKKYNSQTPGVNDYNHFNYDPFTITMKNTKKSSMTPTVSLSTSIQEYLFSSDDELNEENNINVTENLNLTRKLTNSHSITQASKNLSFVHKNIQKKISSNFAQFNGALNAQQSKLLDDLENIYAEKQGEIIGIEKKLFENAQLQKSKNIKEKMYEFDWEINYVINKHKILTQINKYGCIHTKNDSNHDSCDDIEDIKSDDDDDMCECGSDTMAMKQKLILSEIQTKTMDKLDVVILMEMEAKKKAKQAAKLTREVEDGLAYIAERRKEIADKIAVARPELEKAREAVRGIDPKDINEIKSLKSPPSVIENVITATVMILGHKIGEWRDVQKVLSYKFKPELLNFDTYTLSPITRKAVYKKYLGCSDFNYSRVYSGSKVCGNLLLWVLSQIKYSRLLDVIIPLEKEVKKLKKQSKKKEKLAKQLMKIVKELEDNIKLYTNQCNQMIDHIIKSTHYELQQFSDKLQPLNDKFNQLLSNKVLD